MNITPAQIKRYDRQAAKETDTATLGLGCFWGPDAMFGACDGVVRTRVGYAGGTTPDPTYKRIGDHTEVVQVDYNPNQISFDKVIDKAFEQHDPFHQSTKRQYQNIIFIGSDRQQQALEDHVRASGYERNQLETRIEPLGTFHVAESYHQKFNLRDKRWITEPFAKAGYDDSTIRESPAAAKLNSYAAGHTVDLPFLDTVVNDF